MPRPTPDGICQAIDITDMHRQTHKGRGSHPCQELVWKDGLCWVHFTKRDIMGEDAVPLAIKNP